MRVVPVGAWEDAVDCLPFLRSVGPASHRFTLEVAEDVFGFAKRKAVQIRPIGDSPTRMHILRQDASNEHDVQVLMTLANGHGLSETTSSSKHKT
jgi:hypothetical protein